LKSFKLYCPMRITKGGHQEWQIVFIEGAVDSKTSSELRAFLDIEVSHEMPVALELSKVPFMSSAGLRTLLLLHQKTKNAGTQLALVGMVNEIIETMRITGFLQHFTLIDSVELLPST
ncbi:STAS domain-containing protein, partial [Synechococcus lacustris C3-12m-Tous]|uniref:STAS domain-containing protein n=1 Tax=Synechococcus lacustris TaxID=2116544 RepID=UPI0020CCBE2B